MYNMQAAAYVTHLAHVAVRGARAGRQAGICGKPAGKTLVERWHTQARLLRRRLWQEGGAGLAALRSSGPHGRA